MREQKPDSARLAAIDYGQAIKDMARNNIFPGDMLLKNFGMSRHGRAVFYDYDEVCLVTDCTFRDYPEATSYEEEMSDGPWFYVGPKDVFPERFPQFLGLPAEQAAALKAVHGDLFRAQWWRDLQAKLREGEYPDTPPYPDSLRLA